MEPKPVITYFGDAELLGTVLQKKLQTRLKQLQLETPTKEETPCFVFSSLCSGVTFTPLATPPGTDHPPYARPALHTFWTSCVDSGQYRTHDHPLIEQWVEKCNRGDVGVQRLIVYVVTAEVRTKRTRTLTGKPVEERIRADFRAKTDDVIIFRLSDSDPARLRESYTNFTAKVNYMCLTHYKLVIEKEEELVAKQRSKRVEPEEFYQKVFIKKLDLAVCLEMTLQSEKALHVYTEAITDLEAALSQFVATPPPWLEKMCHAPCPSWDYPKLVWTQFSWAYLAGVRNCSSPLLHVRTFFLARLAHLLFGLGRAWSVSELVISTLHCMAREIKTLKLEFPGGAFDCWAYMTCNEAIQAFMALISPDSLQSATSSLLLVRAELWHYALQKLQLIGELCGVMPSSNKLNHDQVLIRQITSGIHPVPIDSVPTDIKGIEDQGRKLIDTLNDRQTFQQEFLRLGEMVIGAFKYAGRRRMAFKVGTTIAQFHRNLGLVLEAEELLSDICKFYSEDQWTQLSTNAYSLLADCQIKLRLEDKYINTMLLLTSLPPYPGASHDPTKWHTSLTGIAQKSPYQKLLNWEPLLQLGGVVSEGGHAYTVGDTVQVEIRFTYHGPKEIKNLIATVELRGESTPPTGSTPSSPRHRPSSPTLTPSLTAQLAQLDELDLSNVEKIAGSRPIGGEGKHRANSQLITHISSAEIAELVDEEGGRGKPPDMLRAMNVLITPGENRVVMTGKVQRSGECYPNKLSLKWGCLDFVCTVPNAPRLTVHPLTLNLDLLLMSEYGVFLEGCSHDCHMTIAVGADTFVPENAQIRLDVGSGITCSEKLVFSLPSMSPNQSHDCHTTLAMDTNTSHDQHVTNDLITWTHKVTAYCDWLSPMYTAVLPVRVYRPLTVRVAEHCGGESAYLQLELVNTCPLPLLLKDPRLVCPLSLTALHSDPQVLYPRESYSLLWLSDKTTPTIGVLHDASLSLNYLPCIHDDQLLTDDYRLFTHSFKVSNLQMVFELRVFVDRQDQSPQRVNTPATLTLHLKNTLTPSTPHTLPSQLDYEVTSEHWTLYEDRMGVVDVPSAGETVVVSLHVCPKQAGQLPLPKLTLAVGEVKLGGAQVQNLSLGQMVAVEPV